MGDVIKFEPKDPAELAKPRKRGSSAERMREITRQREEARARGELPSQRRKAAEKPLTQEEIRERALDRAADLFNDSRELAVNKIIGQLDDPDASVAQRAAKLILEYTDGKPTQTIVERQDGPKVIEYRTAALPAAFEPEPVDETA